MCSSLSFPCTNMLLNLILAKSIGKVLLLSPFLQTSSVLITQYCPSLCYSLIPGVIFHKAFSSYSELVAMYMTPVISLCYNSQASLPVRQDSSPLVFLPLTEVTSEVRLLSSPKDSLVKCRVSSHWKGQSCF